MAKQLNVSMNFMANTSQAKKQLQDLQNQLLNIGKATSFEGFDKLNKDIIEGQQNALKLSAALATATNPKTGRLDLTRFNDSLKQSGTSLKDYATSLQKLGPVGQQSFEAVAQAITNAEVPAFRLNSLFSELWTTMKNTARWQFTSGALHKFVGQVETAYHYAQDLNKSLNNIRIVTEYNTDQMAKFAEQANKAAKTLSTTTVDYTNASLIYYQQGLTDAEVQQRTNVTIKMANVTRQSVEEVSNQLTAIWNNFYDGTTALEHYADVLTALGAATASSSEEISTGLEKFAAVAETVGLSYEYAATALATVTAETRQSAEVVGTAFRTLFARIQDLELGNTLEDGVTLGKYAEALQTIGVNVLDANGGLKDMNDILDEMGKRWKNIDDATKVAVAQAVGGTRQYAQLIALMDNWDTFQSNLTIAKTADGSLQEQQDIYAEGWEAALKRVQAAAESIYSDIIDDDFFIKLADGLTDILKLVDQLIDSMGGLPGLLSAISAIVFKLAGPQISESFRNIAFNIKTIVGAQNHTTTRQDAYKLLGQTNIIDTSTEGGKLRVQYYEQMAKLNDLIEEKQAETNGVQGVYINLLRESLQTKQKEIQNEIKLQEEKKKNLQLSIEELKAEKAKLEEKQKQLKVEADVRAKNQLNEAQKKVQETESNLSGKYSNRFQDDSANTPKIKNRNLRNSTNKFLNQIKAAAMQEINIEELLAADSDYQGTYRETVEKAIIGYGGENVDYNALSNAGSYEKSRIQSFYGNIVQNTRYQELASQLAKNAEKPTEADINQIKKLIQAYKELEQAKKEASNVDITNNKEYQESQKKITEIEEKLNGFEQEISESDETVKKLGVDMDNSFKAAEKGVLGASKASTDWAAKLTSVAQAASSVAFALNSIRGLVDTLKNPDLSAYEKFTSSLMSIGFIAPGIISIFGEAKSFFNSIKASNVSKAFDSFSKGIDNEIKQIESSLSAFDENPIFKIENLKNLQGIQEHYGDIESILKESIPLEEKITKIKGLQMDESAKEVLIEKISTAESTEQVLLEAKKNALQKISNTLKAAGNALARPEVLALIAITALIAGIIIALKKRNELQQKANKELAEAKKYYQELNEAAREANQSVKDLKDSWESLTDKTKGLDNLVKGSIEWKTQLLEINQSVLDLIEKYPELASKVRSVGGLLEIDETEYENLLDKQLEKAKNASLMAQAQQGVVLQKEYQIEQKKIAQEGTPELVEIAKKANFYNDPSYIIMQLRQAIKDGNNITIDDGQINLGTFDNAYIPFDGLKEKAQELIDVIKLEIDNEKKGFQISEGLAEAIGNQNKDKYKNNNYSDTELTALGYLLSKNEDYVEKINQNKQELNGYNDNDLIAEYKKLIDEDAYLANGKFYDANGNEIEKDTIIENLALQKALSASQDAVTAAEGRLEDLTKAIEELPLNLTEEQKKQILLDSAQGNSPDFTSLSTGQILEAYSSASNDKTKVALANALNAKEQRNINSSLEWIGEDETQSREQADLSKTLSAAGIDLDQYETYVELLQEANEELSKDEAKKQAKDNIKLGLSLDKINEALKDRDQILTDAKKGTFEYAEAITDVRNALQDWLNVDFKTDEIQDLWNSGKLQKAVEGDMDAIESISAMAGKKIAETWDIAEGEIVDIFDEAGKEIEESIEVDTLRDKLTSLANDIANDITPSIKINEAEDALNQLLKTGKITAEQAQDYLDKIGYQAEYETQEGSPISTRHVITQDLGNGSEITSEYTDTIYPQVPKIKSVNAKDLAPVTIPNGSRSKNSGGGSSKSSKSANKEIDRYHYTRKVLGNIEDELNRVGKAQDRAFGIDKLKAMNEQISLYNTQLKAQEGYLNEISNYLNKDRAAIEAYGATFDSMGNITNYDALMGRQINTFNASLSDAAEESYNNFKDALSQYEETLSLFQSENDKYQDIVNELASARLTRLKYSIELQVNVKDDTLQYIEFLLGRVRDNAFKTAESLDLLGQKADSNLAKLQTYQKGLRDILSNKNMSDSDITSILEGNFEALDKYKFTEEEIDTIREYKQNILDISGELLEIRDAINESVIKAFDGWIEKIDRTNSAFEHLTNITNSYKNIVGILGRARTGVGDEVIRSLNNTVTKNEIARLEASRQAFLAVQNSYTEAKNALDEAYARGIQDDINKWEETVNHIEDQMNDMEESFLSNWESTLNQITEAFQESMEMAAQAFKNAAVDSYSFESVQDQYNKTKDSREQYLDDLEKQIELSSLLRKVNQDLTKSNNLKNQEALRDLYDEIAGYQEQGVQMTQKDLEYLQKRYDLRVAELALEAAQNDMTTMRLRRNAEGGWSYVYTANQSKIDDATDAAEKKLLELRDFNNSWIDESSSKILETINAIATEITAIDPTLSAEDRMAEQERIINHYRQSLVYNFNNITKALQNNGVLLEDFGDKYAYLLADNGFYSTFSDTILGEALGTFETETDFMQIVFDNLDKFIKKSNEEAKGLEDSFAQIGSGYSDGVLQHLDDVQQKIQGETADLAEEAKTQTDGLKADLEDIIGKVEDWQVANSTAIQAQIDGLEKLVTAYDKLIAKLSEVIALEEKRHPLDTLASNVVSNVSSAGNYSTGGTSNQNIKKSDKNLASSPTYEETKDRDQIRQAAQNAIHKFMDIASEQIPQAIGKVLNEAKVKTNNNISSNRLNKIYAVTMDSGGYTGDWGNASGRLAVLHRKELVLNADDTQNFLNGISILRDITKSIDLSAALLQTDTRLGSIGTIQSQNQTIEQQVHITAEFPNAVDHTEIEQAFDNLIGLASQYAGRKE